MTVVAPVTAAAHGAVHEQIAALTYKIGRAPHDADLYVRRGELHGDHGNWKSALDDFQRAGQLDPSLAIVHLVRGRTLFNAGQFEPAKNAASAARGRGYVPEALHGLDDGIATLGTLATLQLYAIELELPWACRTDAARTAYEQAVAAIKLLAPRHRATRGIVELETQLRDALARLHRLDG